MFMIHHTLNIILYLCARKHGTNDKEKMDLMDIYFERQMLTRFVCSILISYQLLKSLKFMVY